MDTTDKAKRFYNSEANMFVVKIVLVYMVWKAVRYFLLLHGPLSSWWDGFVCFIGMQYAWLTSMILSLFNEHTVPVSQAFFDPEKGRTITAGAVFYPLPLNRIIYVVEHCLAIPATIIFISAIAIYRGSWKNKLWFIPMGVFAIACINLIRLVLLCYTFAHFSKLFFDVNHSVIYVAVTYTLIMLLIIWWMKKYGKEVVAGVGS
jgi:exosortase/archaeosortase family protein